MDKYDRETAARIDRAYQTPDIVNQRLRTLAALGLRQHERVLDAGCGSGLLLEQLALAVGPGGRAAGIDSSTDMLALAESRCNGLEQVELQQGSVAELPFADAEFDALSCCQVLLYVDELEQALAGYCRVLRPGGRLAIIETDWGGAVMNSPDVALTHRIFANWSESIANPYLARRLIPRLRDAGFTGIRVEAIPIVNASYSENTFSADMLEGFARSARHHGVMDAAQSDTWLADMQALIERDEYFFSVNRFLFTAVKPGNP